MDVGAVNSERYERDDNLHLAKSVREKLKLQGHTVLMSREENNINPALVARIDAANAAKADFFISLHRNSFNTPTANGIEIWVRYNNHAVAAAIVLESVANIPHQSNRGVKTGNYLVLYNAQMPAVLLELGFISNTVDNELFDKYLDDYAEAIAKGILAALGEEWKDESELPEVPLYRVQIGAFALKENAEAFLETVRNMGLPAFIISLKSF